jgi:phosphoribosyl-ATP pyrophosphohydrolase
MAKSTKRKEAGKATDKSTRGSTAAPKFKTPVKFKTAAKLRRAMKKLPAPRLTTDSGAAVLDRLWSVIMSRREVDPTISHSARLLSRGPAKVAQKFGEEAVECLIEAVRGDRDAVIAESADVLYHLIVLWVASGVEPDEVWAELGRREGVSGIAEKASRAQTSLVARVLKTTKIP